MALDVFKGPKQLSPVGIIDDLTHLRAVMDLLPVGVLIIEGDSPDTAVTKANNPAFDQILGIPAGPNSDRDSLPYTHYRPDRCTRVSADEWPGILAMTKGEIVRDFELHIDRADGEWRVVLASAAPIFRHGQVGGAVIIVQDITEQKRIEEALRDSEERFRSLADNASDVIMRLDANLRYIYVNPAIQSASGVPPDFFIGKTDAEIGMPSHLVELWKTHAHQAITTRQKTRFEYCFGKPQSPEAIYYESLITPEVGPDDTVQTLLIVSRDITIRKRVEEALRESESRVRAHAAELQAVLDAVPAEVLITRDEEGDYVEGNRACNEIMHCSPGTNISCRSFSKTSLVNFQTMKDGVEIPIDELPVQISAAKGIEVRNYEFDMIHPDGTVRHLLGNAAPLRDDNGKPRGSVAAFIDITERKRAEERMASLQSITAALGQTLTPEQVGDVVVPQTMQVLGTSGGVLVMLTRDSTEVEVVRAIGLPGEIMSKWNHVAIDFPWPISAAIRTGEELIFESRAGWEDVYPRFARMFCESGINALAIFPLKTEGRLLGVVAFSHHGLNSFTDNDVAFMRAIAGQTAQALERSRLYAAESRERDRAKKALERVSCLAERLDQLQNLAGSLSAALTPEEISQVIFEHGLNLLGATGATLSHVVGDDTLELFAATDMSPESGRTLYRFSLNANNPVADAARNQQAIWLESPAAIQERYPQLFEQRKEPYAAWAAIPMIVKERLLGVLTFDFADSQKFDEEIRRFAFALANHCALALERARLYEAERIAHVEAQEANMAKDQFMALISHELRNPLSAIRAGVFILEQCLPLEERTGLGGRISRALEIIDRNVILQARLVNDLLDLSRIARGKLQLQRTPVDLHQVVEAALQANESEANEIGLTLISQLESDLWVQGDFDRLQQVIMNLLSNALKFTPEGGTITVRMEKCLEHWQSVVAGEDSQDVEMTFHSVESAVEEKHFETSPLLNACARIVVEDSGIGIDGKLLGRLFNLFQQGEIGTQRQSGLGIGLTLVKRIIEKHGGQVWAESEGAGKGSRFTVELPLIKGPAVVVGADLFQERNAPIRLMLVEDNPDTRSLIADGLTLAGYEVYSAASGEEALEVIQENPPDIMLCDIGLPGIDGYEFLRRARLLPGMAEVPAFAVTGYGQEEDVRRGKKAGFTGHFVKPVDIASLNRRIQEWFQISISTTNPLDQTEQ